MKPLDGIRVIELARFPPGELAGMLLADMGADVVKVEAPGASPLPAAADGRQAAHAFTNRNKRSIVVNLKVPEGMEILRRLVRDADVLIEGFRPGVMDRLGAGWGALSAINPRLVFCSLSGFGQDGPYRSLPAHDVNYVALAGILGLIGEAGRRPAIPLNLVADYGGASLHAALGIMLALFARSRTGRGQHVDISYLDAAVSLLAAVPSMQRFLSDGIAPRRGEGFLSGAYPYYAVYEAGDGKFLSIGCLEPRFWKNFCKAIGRPDLARFGYRPEHDLRAPTPDEERARGEVEAVLKTKPRDEWNDLLVRAEVCAGKVSDVEEMARDPQVAHRKMIVEIDDARYGKVRQFGVAIKLSETPGDVRTAAPAPGEHTEEILSSLGYGAQEIEALDARGAIGCRR